VCVEGIKRLESATRAHSASDALQRSRIKHLLVLFFIMAVIGIAVIVEYIISIADAFSLKWDEQTKPRDTPPSVVSELRYEIFQFFGCFVLLVFFRHLRPTSGSRNVSANVPHSPKPARVTTSREISETDL